MPRSSALIFISLLLLVTVKADADAEAKPAAAAAAKPAAEPAAESRPVQITPVAYRKAPSPLLDLHGLEPAGSSPAVQKVLPAFPTDRDNGDDWPQYSREITREDREVWRRAEIEEDEDVVLQRQNDKFLKHIPKVRVRM